MVTIVLGDRDVQGRQRAQQIVDAAAVGGRLVGDSRIGRLQGSGIEDTAAVIGGRIAGKRDIGNLARARVIDAAAESAMVRNEAMVTVSESRLKMAAAVACRRITGKQGVGERDGPAGVVDGAADKR